MFDVLRTLAERFELDESTARVSTSPDGVPLGGITCPFERMQPIWEALRAAHGYTGLWPFISHEAPDEWEWEDNPQINVTEFDSRSPVVARLADVVREVGRGDEISDADVDAAVDVIARSLKDDVAPYAQNELIESYFADVPQWLLLTPVSQSYELPLRHHAPSTPNWSRLEQAEKLTYGDHAAVIREWQARHGAYVFYLDSHALVLSVDRPPTSPFERARVALEQYAYCDDLSQVVGELRNIAARQVPSRHWFFWWD